MEGKNFKLLHISTGRAWRGGEQQIAYLIKHLPPEVEQHLICVADEGMHRWAQEQKGLQVLALPKKSGMDLGFARKLSAYSRAHQIDLWHAHDAHAHTFAVLANDFFGGRCPFVLSRRVDFPVRKSFYSRYKYNHPRIAKIFCVSAAIKAVLAPDIKQGNKLVVVHSAVDRYDFAKSEEIARFKAKLGFAESDILIGTMAALVGHKDLFTFLQTAALIHQENPDWRFVIFGEGDLREPLERKRAELGLKEIVQMPGFVPEAKKLLPMLDLFLFTSQMEGLGTSVLDAFAAQIPVVATRAGGIPEMVDDEKSGLLADIGDAKSLKNLCEKVLQNPALKERLQKGGLEKLTQFRPKEMAEKSYELYLASLPY